MTDFSARSRITKALTDSNLVPSFSAAEARLDAVRVCVLVGETAGTTRAGQAAALAAVVTAYKCFGRVSISGPRLDVPLLQTSFAGKTLADAAHAVGACVASEIDPATTHVIRIGASEPWIGWQVSAWWDRWLAGTRTRPADLGSSALPLAGIFAGALAVRQIFAHVRNLSPPREETVSLWDPQSSGCTDRGPKRATFPTRLWLIGLGHLGQAYAWTLLTLPLVDERHVVLQDGQRIDRENLATSLLVGERDIGRRKVRVASDWFEHAGWTTELIERHHLGDIERTQHDPAILLSGLDSVRARRTLARHGFDYMIDSGLGRGGSDFEALQMRVIGKGADVAQLWLDDATDMRERNLAREAYRTHEQNVGTCGVIPLADASVSVPFVGAATAALAIAQLARLGTMQSTVGLLQLELGTPSLVLESAMTPAPQVYLGGEAIDID